MPEAHVGCATAVDTPTVPAPASVRRLPLPRLPLARRSLLPLPLPPLLCLLPPMPSLLLPQVFVQLLRLLPPVLLSLALTESDA